MSTRKFAITGQPPLHAFADDWFDVSLVFEPNQDLSNTAVSEKLLLQAELHLHDGHTSSASELCSSEVAKLLVEPKTPLHITLQPSLSKVASLVKCKIQATVPSKKIIALSIVFILESEANHKHISLAATRPIRLVNYQLYVEPVDWEDVWYKDEGGREKGMTVRVGLRHADGSLAIGQRQVPLRFTLVYADISDTRVHNQNILYIFGDPQQQHIYPETGEAMIRFRIQDVSKNHQGQDFKVQFSVDPSLFTDVAPAYSPAVSVRSKNRSKKRLKGVTTDAHLPQKPPKAARKKESMSTQESKVATTEQLSPQSIPPPDTVTPIPLNRTPSPSAYAVRSAAAAAVSKALFPTTQSFRISEEVPLPLIEGSLSKAIFPPREYSQIQENIHTPLFDGSSNRVKQHIERIISWAEDVVSGLFPLQWTVAGYAHYPDGTVDYNHPYHNMPNPNSFITNILSRYSASVKEDLQSLCYCLDSKTACNDFSVENYQAFGLSLRRCFSQVPAISSVVNKFGYKSSTDPNAIVSINSGKTDKCSSSDALFYAGIETQVSYVLAIPYKTLRSGQSCGYPCFNSEKQLIGFFEHIARRLNALGAERFVPISLFGSEIIDSLEKEVAHNTLIAAISSNSKFLLPVKECLSVPSVLEGCILQEWSKESTLWKPSA